MVNGIGKIMNLRIGSQFPNYHKNKRLTYEKETV